MDVTVFIKTQGIIIKLESRTDVRHNVRSGHITSNRDTYDRADGYSDVYRNTVFYRAYVQEI